MGGRRDGQRETLWLEGKPCDDMTAEAVDSEWMRRAPLLELRVI